METVMSSGSALAGDVNVHLGFWTNWSYGKVQGATITLSRQHGGFLIAFLALFVGLVGKSFWRIACFALHHYLSSANPEDGLYHQRQVILRNSMNGADGFYQLSRTLWAWKGRGNRAYLRLIPIIAAAAVLSLGFGLAGIFSSSISSFTGNEVLISGIDCGLLGAPEAFPDMERSFRLTNAYRSQQVFVANNFALQCAGNASNSEECGNFVKPSLPISVDSNAPCPFSPEVCQQQLGNIFLDSGIIDSHHDLGINMPPELRFQYRIVNHCAPLATNNFTEVKVVNNSSPRLQTMRYYYGAPNVGVRKTNYTFEYPFNTTIQMFNVTSVVLPVSDYSLA